MQLKVNHTVSGARCYLCKGALHSAFFLCVYILDFVVTHLLSTACLVKFSMFNSGFEFLSLNLIICNAFKCAWLDFLCFVFVLPLLCDNIWA